MVCSVNKVKRVTVLYPTRWKQCKHCNQEGFCFYGKGAALAPSSIGVVHLFRTRLSVSYIIILILRGCLVGCVSPSPPSPFQVQYQIFIPLIEQILKVHVQVNIELTCKYCVYADDSTGSKTTDEAWSSKDVSALFAPAFTVCQCTHVCMVSSIIIVLKVSELVPSRKYVALKVTKGSLEYNQFSQLCILHLFCLL